jgi:hypothetical protein
MRSDSYVYQHRTKDTNEIFYVGKGVGNRAFVTNKRSDEWKEIASKRGHKVELLISNIENEFANLIEIETIDSYKKRGYKLINKTKGGGGTLGFKLSAEHKKQISLRMQGNKSCVGRVLSDITKQKIGLKNTGKKHSTETKKRISEFLKGNQYTLGYKHSEEAKQKQRIASLNNPKCKATWYKCTTIYCKDGVSYNGSKEASINTNIPRTTLMRYAKANKNGWSMLLINRSE